MSRNTGYFGKVIKRLAGNNEQQIGEKVTHYQRAAELIIALNESFNDFVAVLMNGFKRDFGIDRSAFFIIDEENTWRLRAKLGDDLPDYNDSPKQEDMINVLLIKENLVSRPKDGVGFDQYMIIRDENRRAIGILAMDDTSKSREFDAEENQSFQSLADTLNILLKQKKNFDDLTVRDPLTGLFNRNIYKEIEKDFANVDCMWMLDIDNFKALNDKFGHPAGDAVLRHLSKYLKQRLRKGDNTVSRHGGEEISVVMKHLRPEDGLTRVEEIAKGFKNERILLPNGDYLHDVTFSVGFYAPKKRQTFEESLGIADKMLYEAKRNGRNRVVSKL